VTVDRLVGTYLRGDVTVYRGTAKAHDNASALANTAVYGPRPDGVIAAGPALALLDVRAPSGGDWLPPRPDPPGKSAILVVHAVPASLHFILEQPLAQPALTEGGLLSGVATTASLVTSCTGCAPSFAGRPATIVFQDLTTTGVVSVFMGYAGQGGKDVNVTATVVASADLALAPPCSLGFDDLVILDSATGPNEIDLTLSSFVLIGNEMVWHTAGSFSVPSMGKCSISTPYTIDVFVDRSDLSRVGTRNFVLGTPAQQCAP
jgi:hypothetical protein